MKTAQHIPHALIALAALFAATASQAQSQPVSPWYGEVGYVAVDVKATNGADKIKTSPSVLSGVIGYQFHPNLAVEGFLGLGLGSSGVKLNGADTGVEAKVKQSIGIFVRPSVRVSDQVELFGRLGYASHKVGLKAGGARTSDSDGDVVYGVGANFHLSKTSYIQGHWTSYYNKDGIKANGLGLAYGMRF